VEPTERTEQQGLPVLPDPLAQMELLALKGLKAYKATPVPPELQVLQDQQGLPDLQGPTALTAKEFP
jgi:hypothetical protein